MQIGEWKGVKQIGRGGFGAVWLGIDKMNREVAIKLVPKDSSAQRELLFAKLEGCKYVLPVIDVQETDSEYAIIMPRASMSLREYLSSSSVKHSESEIVNILKDVISGIIELGERNVVHRDIKPENILMLDGRWQIADFGIARYAESSTSVNTRKFSLTPYYASPEQWRHERATSKSDIYAFGILSYEMCTREWPFSGTADELREQHLHTPSPSPNGCSVALASLITDCLLKSPEARPSGESILRRLNNIGTTSSGAASRLQNVNHQMRQQAAKNEAARSMEVSIIEKRKALAESASVSFSRVIERLIHVIESNSNATMKRDHNGLSISLGSGVLQVSNLRTFPEIIPTIEGYKPSFDVISESKITIVKPKDRYGYAGRSHSLWFCDGQTQSEYRWYETAFSDFMSSRSNSTFQPFALEANNKNALIALSPVMHVYSVAWPFTPFDQGDDEQFVERWVDWLASAAENSLNMPMSMPERNPSGSWRR